VAVEMLAQPDDEYLRFVFNETLNALERRLGSHLDRKNIAQSLVKLLESKKFAPERQASLVQTICRHGGPKELQVVWELSQKQPNAELRKRYYGWLTDAATTRRAQPTVETNKLVALLDRGSPELLESIRLAAAWRVKGTEPTLIALASDDKAPQAIRFAA